MTIRKGWFNLKEAAQWAGLPAKHLYNATAQGKIKHSLIGDRIYFSIEDLDAYMESGRREIPRVA